MHSARTVRFGFAIVAACALVTAAEAQSRRRAKVYVDDLQALFQEVDRNYPFFDLKGIRKEWQKTKADLLKRARKCKSDQAFVELLFAAARCLRDGHLAFPELKVTPERAPEFYPEIAFLPATEGRVVVLGAADAALKPGTVITRIDGVAARAFLDRRGEAVWQEGGFFSSPQRARFFEYRLPLHGERGAKHTLHYLDGKRERTRTVRCTAEVKGWEHNYNLPADLVRAGRSVYHTLLDDGFGYVYLRRMDRTAEADFAAAVAAHPDAKGWIVDLRGNTGGGYDSSFKAKLAALTRPVAGILDAGCVSAGETFARDLVEHADARLFGAVTAGSSSSKKEFPLPSGLATIRYSVRGRRGIDGKVIEFLGIAPHVEVEAVPEEVARGANSALLRAREALAEQIAKGGG